MSYLHIRTNGTADSICSPAKTTTPSESIELQTSKDNPDGFSRLMQLMLGKQYTSHPSFAHCQHQKFSRYFRRKLKCDSTTFNLLCSQLASKIAEKNYQLQTINVQLASIAQTAQQEANNPEASTVTRQIDKEGKERKKKITSIGNIETKAKLPDPQMLGYERVPEYWMGVPPPPIMHFPWMFPHPGHHGN